MDRLLAKVAKFYDDAIATYGPVAQGVNWKDAEKQEMRFRHLATLLDGETEPFTVADLGCGYAALYDYLRPRNAALEAYHGYDVAPRMIAAAEARIGGEPSVQLSLGDTITEDVDFAFASGIFNVRLGQDESAWRQLVLATLDNMHARSRRGFAFNLMSDKVDWRDNNLFYANPGEFVNFCLDRYSRCVRLLHDMPLHEWTMIVLKPQRRYR